MDLVVRPPLSTRLLGVWMCVLGAVACAIAAAVGLVVFALAGVAMMFWGVRVTRLAVFCDANGIKVRNRFRSWRVGWQEIVSVGIDDRDKPPLTPQMRERAAGLVRLRDGRQFYLDATESFRYLPTGSSFSMTPGEAETTVAQVRGIWQASPGYTKGPRNLGAS